MHLIQNFPFFSIVLPFFCGVACFLLGRGAAKWLSLACLAALGAMSCILLAFTLETGESFVYRMGHFPSPFVNELSAGPLEALMALLLCCISLLSLSGGLGDINRDIPGNKTSFYFMMVNILTGAMLAIIYTNDIFTAFVFIEIVTIAVCSLIMIKPGGPTLSATIVYLVFSLISSCLILFSIAMVYSITGHLLFPGIQAALAELALTGAYTLPLFVSAALFTTGLAVKFALFPFHVWLPRAYVSATTASSSLMSGFVGKCFFILLIKAAYRMFGLNLMEMLRISHLLLALGLAGIVYGSLKALGRRDTKGMLAYASIAQAGCISVAIGLNTDRAMGAVCFHIIVHGIGKAMLFTAAGGLAAVSGGRNGYDFLRGAARRDPLSGAAFIIASLTMIGFPPFPGFFSKLYFTLAALETAFAVPAILGFVIVSTLLSAMYFFPALGSMLAREDRAEEGNVETSSPGPAPTLTYRGIMITFISLTLLLGIFSRQILEICERGLAVF